MFFSNILNLKNLPSGPIFSRVLRIRDRYVFRGKVSDQTILILLSLSFSVTVFAGVLFVYQPGGNHGHGASVT